MSGLADLVRRRQTPCTDVAMALPAYVAGEAALDARSSQHVAQCLRCQGEIVHYRRMLRTLRDLRDDTAPPPTSMLAEIIGQLGAGDTGSRALLGLVTVAMAAGAAGGAGAVLWLTRRSRAYRGLEAPGGPSWVRPVQEMATRFSMSRAITKPITSP